MIFKKIFLLTLLCAGTLHGGVLNKLSGLNPFSSYKPVESEDVETTTDLLRSAGYQCEEHTVTTPDGYLITIHRIPFGANEQRTDRREQLNKPAVLLQTGGFSSSSVWVLNAPENCLPCALADAGFDVWLGNQRGNTYGRKHIYLSPMMSKFWDFSLDEVGTIDIPAIVDYVVECKDEESGESEQGMDTRQQFKLQQQQQPNEDLLKSITDKFKHKVKGTWMEQMIPSSGWGKRHSRQAQFDIDEDPKLSGKRDQEQTNSEKTEWIYGGAPVRQWYTSDRELDSMTNKQFVGTPDTVHRFKPEVVGGQIGDQPKGMLPESVSHRFKQSWKNLPRSTSNSIFMIGFGQGALAGLMGLSKSPQLSSKIKLFIVYGMLNDKSLMKVPLYKILKNCDVNDLFKKDMVLSSVEDREELFKNICDKREDLIRVMYDEPDNFLYFLGGLSRYVNRKNIPDYLPHILSGTSKNVLVHISQMLKHQQRLQCFDSSEESTGLSSMFNLNKLLPKQLTKTDIKSYSPIQTLPEEYKLENIQVPVAIISSDVDPTTPTPDHLDTIARRIPNLIRHEVILNYGLFDFLFADNLRTVVVDKIIDLLKV